MVNWLYVAGVAVATLAVMAIREQLRYRRNKAWLPGPNWIPPLIGNVVSMIMGPVEFYSRMAVHKYCANSLIGRFFLYITDTKTSRKMFFEPEKFTLYLTLGAKPILGEEHNIAFINGDPHKALRKRLAPMFTPRALGTYIGIQENTIRQFFKEWASRPGYQNMQVLSRDLTAASSQNVFVGPYLSDEKHRNYIKSLYYTVTQGMLAFPINLPGFAVYRAVKAREKLIVELSAIVEQSKAAMRAGKQPQSLLDFWMEEEMRMAAKGETTYDNTAISFHMLDFLFASQDASTTSLVWAIDLMYRYPDVAAKVRAEQKAVRPNDEPFTADLLDRMPYTMQVVREVLRFRPPVPFVPHVAEHDVNDLIENFTVPKGAIIFPDIVAASRQGFPQPDTFDPDRFSPERNEHIKYADNYMIFGCGPHLCLGRQYAMNQLAVFIGLAVTLLHFDRQSTPDMDKIKYMPTVVPKDNCPVQFRLRSAYCA